MLPPSDKTWMPHSITTNPFFKTVIFFVSFFFRASLPELVLLYLPTHCTLDGGAAMAAVVLLLIQGKLTDENNGKKFH